MRRLRNKVKTEVKFEEITIIHFGKFALEIREDLFKIEAIPFVEASAKYVHKRIPKRRYS